MSSRREVLIRILALLQRKTLIETKKSHIRKLKMALFDSAINEKKKVAVLTEDKAFTLFVSSPHRKIWQLKSPHPREFAIQDKKNAVARGSAGGGGGLGAGGIGSLRNYKGGSNGSLKR